MIQRKQSIVLFLSGIISSLFAINFDKVIKLVLPWLTDPNKGNALFQIALYSSAAISFLTIFLFKNRKIQLKLGWLNILVNIILIGSLLYCLLNLPGDTISEKGIWACVPLLSIALLSIANRLIKKDDDLVKSVERFR